MGTNATSSGPRSHIDLRLPADRNAASAARHALDHLEGTLGSDTTDNLRLLVSELVTNSVRHAGLGASDWIALTVRISDIAVRVEVADPGLGFEPVITSPSLYQESGWGLWLVARIAARWGVTRERGATVWFEVDRGA